MKNKFFILYTLFILIFTIYVLLDTFLITKEVKKVDNNTKIINDSNNIIKTDNTYIDDNITIKLNEYYEYETKIYVADIIINNSELLKTAFANNTYGKNITEKTSVISQDVGAILSINGDYYGVQENGYVLKNGIIYRNTSKNNQEDLVIYKDGSFEIINEEVISLDELLSNNAYNVLSFGPALINNYNIVVDENTEVGKAMSSNPRTAICYIDKNHYLFVVSDGRTSESKGLSLYELSNFLKDLNVKYAYNLDGGGSSTMYFNGNIINKPTTTGRNINERKVSDIVYIGY